MAYAAVQGKAAAISASTSWTIAFTSNVAVNDLLIVALRINSATITVSSVADGLGNTYAAVQAATVGATRTGAVYYTQVTTGGACTVTVTVSNSIGGSLAIEEYSGGLTGVDPRDQTNGAAGTSTTPSSGNITTTFANDLIVGMLGNSAGTPTEDAAFTNRQALSATLRIADRIVSATETRAYLPTLLTSVEWEDIIVGFKAASAAGGIPPGLGPVVGMPEWAFLDTAMTR